VSVERRVDQQCCIVHAGGWSFSGGCGIDGGGVVVAPPVVSMSLLLLLLLLRLLGSRASITRTKMLCAHEVRRLPVQ
jgi:hypothetical protein